MGRFRFIDDWDYGFTLGNTIHVNIQRLWEEEKNEDSFISRFSELYVHELLHVILGTIGRKNMMGEEKVIHLMLEEPWEPWMERRYLRDYVGKWAWLKSVIVGIMNY